MTILALDFGTRRVGLAISHGVVAAPLQSISYDRSNKQAFFSELQKIVIDQSIEKVIIGLSLRDNEPTKQSEISKQIGNEISEKLGIPVDFVDESFTSIEAKENNAKDIDSESAKIILERYLPR